MKAKTKEQIREEALVAIGDRRRAGIEVSMGVGKTLTGLEHMARQYVPDRKYLVVAPRRAIFKSWTDEIEKFGLDHLSEQITFTTYRSLIKQDYDYDYIYLDECHSLKAIHNKWLLGYLRQGGRLLGMTGTYPVRPSTEKGKMCYFYCPRVYKYTPDEAINDKILNDYRIIIHELTLNKAKDIPRQGAHGDFKVSEYSDYQFWTGRLQEVTRGAEEQKVRIQRMKALQKYKTKEVYAQKLLNAQKDKTIIFANTQAQADKLCKHSVHSANKDSAKNLEAFKKGAISKLSAVEQLSEGVTIPGLKVGIILHSYGNNRKASQKLGRMLRLNPKDVATVHILCYMDTIDKTWVKDALKTFDKNKISWVKPQ